MIDYVFARVSGLNVLGIVLIYLNLGQCVRNRYGAVPLAEHLVAGLLPDVTQNRAILAAILVACSKFSRELLS